MSQDNYALLTRTGRLKEAQRMAGQSVPAITHMAFGDMDRAPTGGETALGHEVHRAALTGWGAYADETAAYFDCYLSAAIGGFVIREVGLFDAAGDLIAIARRSPGLPKTTPENGGGDDFTLRIDVFLEDLDTLVVQVSPIAGLTADNLRNFLYPNNLPVEAVLSSAPGAPIAGGQWIVAPNPTGIWTGRAHQIARWRGAWEYETPRAGRLASYWSGARLVQLRFDGASWAEWLATTGAAGPVKLAAGLSDGAGVPTVSQLLAAFSLGDWVYLKTPGFVDVTVPDGMNHLESDCLGAGGAGGASSTGGGSAAQAGNAGAGGHAGGRSIKRTLVTPGQIIRMTVGAGGLGQEAASGLPGGTSSVGSIHSATGGGRGLYGGNSVGTIDGPGTGIGGDINVSGGYGGPSTPGTNVFTESMLLSLFSRGGIAPGGYSALHGFGTGQDGIGRGSGGGGASGGSGLPGGRGADGLIAYRFTS